MRTVLILLLLAAAHLVLADKLDVSDGRLFDPDAYTRLIRVAALAEHGDWFHAHIDRVNPPDGLTQHWTRPMDAALLGTARAVEAMAGVSFDRALGLAAIVLPPLLSVAVIAILLVGLGGVVAPAVLLALGAVFVFQPGLISAFVAGRSDHNALLMLWTAGLFVAVVRLLVRPGGLGLAALGGLLAVGALWTGVETLVPVVGVLAAAGLVWIVRPPAVAGAADLAAKMIVLTAVASVAGLAALWFERGAGAWTVGFEVDRYSQFHAAIFPALFGLWAVIGGLEALRAPMVRGRVGRFAVGAALAAAAAGAVLLAFPQILAGDWIPMDPFYRATRFEMIAEYRPVIMADRINDLGLAWVLQRAVSALGVPLVGALWLAWVIWRDRDRPVLALWLVSALTALTMVAVFGAVGGLQGHDAPYLQLALLAPYADGLCALRDGLGRRLSGLALALVRGPVTVLALVWPVLPMQLYQALVPPAARVEVRTIHDDCRITGAAAEISARGPIDGRRPVIMAHVDHGPELLYRTRAAVMSIPNHRYQSGYRATFDVMTATEPEAARRVLAERGVDYLIVCPGRLAAHGYAAGGGGAFRDRLLAEPSPPWLTPLPVAGVTPDTVAPAEPGQAEPRSGPRDALLFRVDAKVRPTP